MRKLRGNKENGEHTWVRIKLWRLQSYGNCHGGIEGGRHRHQKQNSPSKCKCLQVCQNLGEDVRFLIECGSEETRGLVWF